MSEELGCAQNPDRTLKDASEIVFTYSREASPVNLSALLPDIHASTGIHPQTSTVNDTSLPKDPAHSKAPKLKHQKPQKLGKQSSTAAVKTQQCVAYTYGDKLEILDFAEGPGKSLSQEKIAEHFRDCFPKLHQSSVHAIIQNATHI
ncbi:uncharacterized protein FOMMEDRAFT_161420 [Fomitiporia mediterranea MF3/22]|uniref:uncharacterized protein n=1 Tax=Fomitiporia mediterranea (strain MF3/22) TaxID=694068 RepID=UPI0004409732|nr:uncharacterized protein FOMMEDRAFT_161420 [Fomitiporia mediterranea MF3/22]EJC98601.1 hypothetical protein FOMMEDRAFT_161420 [Fomitiporia mediterranea MF3/22]